MSVYEQFSDDNNMEHRTSPTSKASNMKYGWHQIVNDTVHYFQMPYNIAVIVEQLSNYNMMVREQIAIEKDGFKKQNTLISDEIRYKSKLCTAASECTPKMQYDKSDGDDSKDNSAWINPKKSTPITYFSRSTKRKKILKKLITNIAC